VTLEEVADGLYAKVPDEFVAARDAAVRQARADGDNALAAALAGLRRPTVGAWLANLLVREHRSELTDLVELGSALRDAQSSLDGVALRDLARQRQQVVAALVGLARRAAAEQGRRVGAAPAAELESTLVAALADPDAAQRLLAGQLSSSLAYAGLGFGAASAQTHRGRPGTPAPPPTGKPRATTESLPDPRASRAALVDEAERALVAARLQEAEADEACQRAGDGHAQALDGLDAARARLGEAAAQVDAARVRLEAAQAQVEQAQAGLPEAKQDLTRAERQRSQARRAVEHARKELDRVTR
jgi:hypothetical protein